MGKSNEIGRISLLQTTTNTIDASLFLSPEAVTFHIDALRLKPIIIITDQQIKHAI
jgi:hypothetical protein